MPGEGECLVSVIVPAYNAAKTIDETLRSVRAQTYRNLEVIVVDDGSTDETGEIARSHARRDSRVRLIKQGNAGVAAARNRGIAESSGDIIAPVDADDLWHSDKIGRQMEVLGAAGERVGLVYCWYAIIDAKSRIRSLHHRPTEEGDVLVAMCKRNLVGNGSSALMRKSAVLQASAYDSSLRERDAEGCEDFKLYLQIAERHHFAVVRDHLTGYRRTRANMSSNALEMLRSRDLVVDEFARKYPQFRSLFREGRNGFLKWLLINSVRSRRYGNVASIAKTMIEEEPQLALKTFPLVPVTLFRGAMAPYLHRILNPSGARNLVPLSKFTIGSLDSDPALVVRPLVAATE